jgi:DNA-directed RNA polymerase specialized sigma24 family protein
VLTTGHLLPDATLIERIAALGDKDALAELDRRHGMTLYAIAYTLLLDSDASDAVVANALREVWRQAASFDVRLGTGGGWMADLTRRAARARLRARRDALAAPAPVGAVVPLPLRRASASAARPGRVGRRAARLARVLLARAARFAAVVVLPAVLQKWARA